MKILYISHDSTLHGSERAFAETLEALYLSGHELYTIFSADGPIIEFCKPYLRDFEILSQIWWYDRGIRLDRKEKNQTLKKIVRCVKKTYKVIKQIDPDIVISNTSVIPCGAIASKLARKKHIWYFHEAGKKDLNYNLIYGTRLSLWLANKLSSKVLFNSFFLESYYQKYISPKKREVVYQAVKLNCNDMTMLPPKQPGKLTLILMGRFAEGKGQMEAIHAVHRLIRQGENIELLLVGAGQDDYSDQVKNYIEKNYLFSVKAIDFVKDICDYYRLADVMLVCSRCEAFGRITIEAMKMGLPVIVSHTGANPELVKEGFNGFLYEYGNIEDLSQKILQLKDDHIRHQIAQQAQRWALDTFTLNNYAQRLNEIIIGK